MSIRFNLPVAKNPIARPSGAQNGALAPSVPRSTRASTVLKGRTHRCGAPSLVAT